MEPCCVYASADERSIICVQQRQNSSRQGRITGMGDMDRPQGRKNGTAYFRPVWEMIKLTAGVLDIARDREISKRSKKEAKSKKILHIQIRPDILLNIYRHHSDVSNLMPKGFDSFTSRSRFPRK